jgi:hypothetical protein
MRGLAGLSLCLALAGCAAPNSGVSARVVARDLISGVPPAQSIDRQRGLARCAQTHAAASPELLSCNSDVIRATMTTFQVAGPEKFTPVAAPDSRLQLTAVCELQSQAQAGVVRQCVYSCAGRLIAYGAPGSSVCPATATIPQ